MSDETEDAEAGTAGHGRAALEYINDETKYYPHQIEGVRWLAVRPSFLLADEMGGGKAQPITEPVLTPTGWTPIGQLGVGDHICKPSGGTQTIVATHPQGQKDTARVTFSDGTSVLCTWDHLWTVSVSSDGTPGSWVTMPLREIHAQVMENGPDSITDYQVPIVNPTHGGVGGYPVDPFTAGFLIAGGATIRPRTSAWGITLGREEAAKLCHIPGAKIVPSTKRSHDMTFLFKDIKATQEFYKWIHEAGITYDDDDKFISPAVMFGPWETRLEFLMGVIAARGSVAVAGQRFILRGGNKVVTSNRLMHDFAALVRSLGGLALIEGDVLTMWWEHPMRLPSGTTVTTPKPRKYITSIVPLGKRECICITVDNDEGLYITSDYTVTHNSLQALTVAAIDFERGMAQRIIIVCPVSLKDNWQGEIEKHTSFQSLVLAGTPKQRDAQLLDFMVSDKWQVLIVNYEQVEAHLDKINGSNFDIAIFDEAHYMKNYKSKRTKAAHKIAAARSFVLTGSPMLNQPNELWGLLHRINPAEFPKYWDFVNRFCRYGGFNQKQIVGVKNRIELLEILDRYMLRRLKSEMVKLPDKNFIQETVPLSALQAKLYKQAESELQIEMDNGEVVGLDNVLVKMLKLKQITGTPFALDPEFDDSSIKLDRAIEICKELHEDGERAVVFTQFRGVHAAMVRRVRDAKLPVFELHGDVKQADRVPVVNAWSKSDRGVLVCMVQVGGVGLDFTAASNVIFLDKLYVPALNDQAVDRLHRLSMDKTKQVNIYELLAKGTVEDRVEKILRDKRKLGLRIVDSKDFRKLVVDALHDS